MRILYVIPYPMSDADTERRAAQIPRELLSEHTDVVCVPVRDCVPTVESHYESLVVDVCVLEAAMRAEEQGYDAVLMDTASDAGILAMRSRLSILTLAPGLVSYSVALMLGKRFSIITMWEPWRFLLEANLVRYKLTDHCASIRAINVPSDVHQLLDEDDMERVPPLIEAAARAAIDEDGADVIVLGSTSMHQVGDVLRERLEVPVINPGPVAIKMAETLLQLGFTHSRVAYPPPISLADDMLQAFVDSRAVQGGS